MTRQRLLAPAPALALLQLLAGCLFAAVTLTTAASAANPRDSEPAHRVGSLPDVLQIVERFVAAAHRHDVVALRALLSSDTRAELDPLPAFAGLAKRIEQTVGTFPLGKWQIVLTEPLGPHFAIVTIAGARATGHGPSFMVYAAALRLERGGWKIELSNRVRIRPLIPIPGREVTVSNPQIAAEIDARAPVEEAELWVDSQPVPGKGGGQSANRITVFGRPPRPLPPGRHMAVAYAIAGDVSRASAWIFSVRPGSRAAATLRPPVASSAQETLRLIVK